MYYKVIIIENEGEESILSLLVGGTLPSFLGVCVLLVRLLVESVCPFFGDGALFVCIQGALLAALGDAGAKPCPDSGVGAGLALSGL